MNRRDHRCTVLQQAIAAQTLTSSAVLKLGTEINSCRSRDERIRLARALRDLVSAFDTACDRVRILRGVPLPGQLSHVPKEPKTKKVKGGWSGHFIEVGKGETTTNGPETTGGKTGRKKESLLGNGGVGTERGGGGEPRLIGDGEAPPPGAHDCTGNLVPVPEVVCAVCPGDGSSKRQSGKLADSPIIEVTQDFGPGEYGMGD